MEYQSIFTKYFNKTKESTNSPRIFPFALFELPRNSAIHYIPLSTEDKGPPANFSLIKNAERKVSVYHVKELATTEGKPVPLTGSVGEEIRDYHQRNKKLIKTETFKNGVTDKTTPMIVNYSFANNRHRYPNNVKTGYYRSLNLLNTVIRTAAKLADETDVNQFIFINLPRKLSKLTFLDSAEKEMADVHWKRLNNFDEVALFHLWMWCGDNREKSAFNYLTPEQMSKINLVFLDSSNFSLMNMEFWNSFRKNKIEDKAFEPRVFQIRFIKFEIKMVAARTDPSLIETVDDKDDVSKKQDVQKEDVEDIEDVSIDTTLTAIKDDAGLPDDSTLDDDEDLEPEFVEKDDLESQDTSETSIDQDKLLEELTEENIDSQIEEIDNLLSGGDDKVIIAQYENPVEITDTLTDYEAAAVAYLDDVVGEGTMTAATYKKKLEQTKKFKSIVIDKGDKVINFEDYINITPEELKVDPVNPLTELDTVTDKRLLNSSLHNFDSKYITEIMDRDIALACTSMQRAGACITGFDKTTYADAVSAYDIYSVKFSPIEGQSSTVRFKVPKLNEKGVFKVNGREYVMRKQKGDIPIRKVNSQRVALTSYYGKIFIDLAERRQNNYARWLTNNIRSFALDKTNTKVLESRSGNFFDSTAKVPSLYSILSSEFKTISIKHGEIGLFFYLDYKTRKERLGEATVEAIEKTGYTVIGQATINKNKLPIVVDFKNNLYYIDPKTSKITELPSIEELVGLSPQKAPVESAELNVLGKTIPLGMCLGYLIGIDALLKKLKISYREVQAGTRLNLTNEEVAIKFSDIAIVYNKKDDVASLILNGFNTYADSIIDYSYYQFNSKPVYLNVLDSKKITLRYLRELDMMSKLFVDPITEKLLIAMKEPTNFKDLLVRSAQLLVTRDHPDEIDGVMQRIKGYERMTGAVYNQMVRSMKQFNSRGSKANHGIELHPEAVWMDILTDTAKAPYNELNPIQNLKHHEAVIFSGTGGRTAQSMVKRTRAYHKNDLGVISESTVDSGNVALNVYLSPDAKFTNLYGISDPINPNDAKELNPAQIYSTSALLYAGVDGDD